MNREAWTVISKRDEGWSWTSFFLILLHLHLLLLLHLCGMSGSSSLLTYLHTKYVSCNNSKVWLTVIFGLLLFIFCLHHTHSLPKDPCRVLPWLLLLRRTPFGPPSGRTLRYLPPLKSPRELRVHFSCTYFNLHFTTYISNFPILNRHFGSTYASGDWRLLLPPQIRQILPLTRCNYFILELFDSSCHHRCHLI
jgi:hypothetical protein